jgi:hypothetical protein
MGYTQPYHQVDVSLPFSERLPLVKVSMVPMWLDAGVMMVGNLTCMPSQ